MNNHGLRVTVHKWREFVQAWMQKLLATIISAKVMITIVVIVVSYQLAVTKHTYEIVLQGDMGQSVGKITAPYLSGADWANLIATVIVAFIGARVMPQLLESIGNGVGNVLNSNNGKVSSSGAKTPEQARDITIPEEDEA